MRTCDVEGCDRPHNARGLCKWHYYRVYREPGFVPLQKREPKNRVCDVPNCGRPHHGHGWCESHYMRWRNHGDVMAHVPIESAQFQPGKRTANARPFDLDDTDEL